MYFWIVELVTSTKPVAVFAGNECSTVPSSAACIDGNCNDSGLPCQEDIHCPSVCCCDHLEEQLLPTNALGTHYVCVRSEQRNGEMDYWRVLATEDGTVVTLTPQVVDSVFLGAGEFYEFGSLESLEIRASKPVAVGQFFAGEYAPGPNYSPCTAVGKETAGVCSDYPEQECLYHEDCPIWCSLPAECEAKGLGEDAGIGDPSFIMQIPVSHYRTEYVFLIPDKYALDYAGIAVPANARLWVDDVEVPVENFPEVGTGEYVQATSMMSDGVHHIRSNRPIGITVYGFDRYVSYGYPAGMSAKTILGER